MAIITICTPTYNRAYTLTRPFLSLQRQSSKDFVWLIVDDGSTDETRELVESFKEKADFPIQYIWQENKGRAQALNTSYQYIQTELVINLDSDDELMDSAIQTIIDIWNNLSHEEKTRIWCITGQCIDSQTKEIIGNMWPENINKLTGKAQYKYITKIKTGEKSCCRKVSILKKYPFPCYSDTKFVPEDIIWCKINHLYDQYCVNNVFRVYYRNSTDSLSNGKHLGIAHHISLYYLYLSYINECFAEILYNHNVRFSIYGVCRQAIRIGKTYTDVMRDIDKNYKKFAISVIWPIIKLYSFLRK